MTQKDKIPARDVKAEIMKKIGLAIDKHSEFANGLCYYGFVFMFDMNIDFFTRAHRVIKVEDSGENEKCPVTAIGPVTDDGPMQCQLPPGHEVDGTIDHDFNKTEVETKTVTAKTSGRKGKIKESKLSILDQISK